jgi:hypothetical protein
MSCGFKFGNAVTIQLTFVSIYVHIRVESRSPKVVSRVTAVGGASAVPAGGGSSLLLSGGSGISLPTLWVLAATGAGARRDTPAS